MAVIKADTSRLGALGKNAQAERRGAQGICLVAALQAGFGPGCVFLNVSVQNGGL